MFYLRLQTLAEIKHCHPDFGKDFKEGADKNSN